MDSNDNETVSVIALNRIFGYQPKIALSLIRNLGSASAVFDLDADALKDVFGPCSPYPSRISRQELDIAAEEHRRLLGMGFGFIRQDQDAYPQNLLECEDPPVVLYVRSSSPLTSLFNGAPCISIVGTRDISMYGKEWCERIVGALSQAPQKPTIVSGLAIGVDITAHMAALASGLPTIGVSPVGIDDVYPRRHSVAAAKIAASEGGAIITDYPPGTAPVAVNFLRRNRIIAGLSNATILVESKRKGGGTMTARLASGYGRDVFCLPGRIDDLRSEGCNLLIQEKLAEPIISLRSLPEALGLGRWDRRNTDSLESELDKRLGSALPPERMESVRALARLIKRERGISLDDLCVRLHMPYQEVSAAAMTLESNGFISIDLMQRCCINAKID